jgi:methionine biosynthesis protein MetW
MKSDNTKNYYDNYWTKFSTNDAAKYFRSSVFPEIFNKKEKILDLACGDGKTSVLIKSISGGEVVGVDCSPVALSSAKKLGIKTKEADVEVDLPFESASFDTVFWGDNIEHIFNPRKTLSEIFRVLRKSGRLVMSTPNSGYWRYRLEYLLTGRIPDTEYNGKKFWEWSHIRVFDLKRLREILGIEGFYIKTYYGLSGRRFDKIFSRLMPKLFGMVFVIEAYKK